MLSIVAQFLHRLQVKTTNELNEGGTADRRTCYALNAEHQFNGASEFLLKRHSGDMRCGKLETYGENLNHEVWHTWNIWLPWFFYCLFYSFALGEIALTFEFKSLRYFPTLKIEKNAL